MTEPDNKDQLDAAMDKVLEDYGETLRLLGEEE